MKGMDRGPGCSGVNRGSNSQSRSPAREGRRRLSPATSARPAWMRQRALWCQPHGVGRWGCARPVSNARQSPETLRPESPVPQQGTKEHHMRTNAKLYEQDVYAWAQTTAALLRAGKWHEVDVARVA